ncbi:heme ABC transporter ATP-binding protein [Sphingobacterium cellulitidis]|uniref:heme ABC transporter ATP-binding protein n=1 Tax=Sphingobacterium cellulitidis TaxID=1768011 RepID=UPI000B940C4F|nr:heme ABC transporter ATP-binding protein [Sphingobacterium cellulitidis]
MIEVSNLSYKLGNRLLLEDISFKANSFELLAILGPNGAGKSTLLKILSKQIKTYFGDVKIKGQDLKKLYLNSLSKFRAVLPQSNYLNINLTVFDVILMGRYPHFKANPNRDDIEICHLVLEEMGLTKYKDCFIHQLSGGEQQRVQLARVLAQIYADQQAILLMDEPITGLDLQYQQIILEKARLLADKGVTVICVLHDINLASQFADRILLLKNGKKMAYGCPKMVLTEDLIYNTYKIRVKKIQVDEIEYPIIVPYTARSASKVNQKDSFIISYK